MILVLRITVVPGERQRRLPDSLEACSMHSGAGVAEYKSKHWNYLHIQCM